MYNVKLNSKICSHFYKTFWDTLYNKILHSSMTKNSHGNILKSSVSYVVWNPIPLHLLWKHIHVQETISLQRKLQKSRIHALNWDKKKRNTRHKKILNKMCCMTNDKTSYEFFVKVKITKMKYPFRQRKGLSFISSFLHKHIVHLHM